MSAPATVRDALGALTQSLRAAGVENASRDAQLILAHVLGVEAGRLVLMAPDPVPAAQSGSAMGLAERRGQGEPLSHLTGARLFWGRSFHVDARVLDPRPETETLIAEALSAPFKHVLDLGTGSGAIIVTLLAERATARGVATDLSPDALEVARANAQALGVMDRVRFVESDWFAQVDGRFDLIVSNPPYIAADEMASLSRELGYEPRMALTDEADGLTAYRVIAARVPDFLVPGGRVMVEIGPTQGPAVARLFEDAGLADVRVLADLDGRDRVVAAQAVK